MNTQQVAKRLVELCRAGRDAEAQKELYASDAVSVEPREMPGMPKETKGLVAILQKGERFRSQVEAVHAEHTSDPMVAGEFFTVNFALDCTMKGRGRVELEDIGIYRVADGKIVSEQFFY